MLKMPNHPWCHVPLVNFVMVCCCRFKLSDRFVGICHSALIGLHLLPDVTGCQDLQLKMVISQHPGC